MHIAIYKQLIVIKPIALIIPDVPVCLIKKHDDISLGVEILLCGIGYTGLQSND